MTDDLCHVPRCHKGSDPHIMHNVYWEGPRIVAYWERMAEEEPWSPAQQILRDMGYDDLADSLPQEPSDDA